MRWGAIQKAKNTDVKWVHKYIFKAFIYEGSLYEEKYKAVWIDLNWLWNQLSYREYKYIRDLMDLQVEEMQTIRPLLFLVH